MFPARTTSPANGDSRPAARAGRWTNSRTAAWRMGGGAKRRWSAATSSSSSRTTTAHDLARLVPPAEPDAEIALQTFLEKLPSKVKATPSLDVAPRRLLVPNVRRGDDRRAVLTILNRGIGPVARRPGRAGRYRAGCGLSTTKVRTRSEQPVEVTIDSASLPDHRQLLRQDPSPHQRRNGRGPDPGRLLGPGQCRSRATT